MSADFYATDEDDESITASGTILPIGEVPSDRGGSGDHGGSTQRSHDQEIEGVLSDTGTSTVTALGRAKRKNRKGRNGLEMVEMTPPDRRLRQAEKQVERCRQQAKPDAAIRSLVRCTALARISYGDGHWKLARAYSNLARGYYDLKDYMAQAHCHAEHAKSVMMSTADVSSSSTDRPLIVQVLVDIYFLLGQALTALNKYPLAGAALSRAETVCEELAKIASVTDVQIDMNNINIARAFARLYARQQKFAMATTYFEKALASMELIYGRDSVRLIPLYHGLGNVEQGRGGNCNHEKVIEYFQQAHSIASAKYDSNSDDVADTGLALALAYSNVGSEAADMSAEGHLNESLVIYQSLYGDQYEKTIQVQDELARLMVRTRRHQEAVDILKSTMSAKVDVNGDLSEEVADVWKLIGSIHLSQAETDKGMKALKKCYNIECLVHGSNSRKSKDTLRTIDLLLANPRTAVKERKQKADDLKSRPRFSSIVNRGSSLASQNTFTY